MTRFSKFKETKFRLINNPPCDCKRAPNTSFWAGFDGVKGVRYGAAGTIARAAWEAGDYCSRYEPERTRALAARSPVDHAELAARRFES